MNTKDYELLINKLDIEVESIDKQKLFDNIYFWSGDSKGSVAEVNYLIFLNSNEAPFSYDVYKKLQIEELPEHKIIMIFDDLNQETIQYYDARENCSTGKEKRELMKMFDKKSSLFRNKQKIQMYVNDGINFLEYLQSDSIIGNVYNVSFYELCKMLVACGVNLFKRNVRNGISTDSFSKRKLVHSFETYIKTGLYVEYKKEMDADECFNSTVLQGYLELEEQDLVFRNPDLFWFGHNGVSVFVEGERLEIINSTIELDLANASVINGAQTMTNLYKSMFEIRLLCENMYGKEGFEFVKKKFDKKEEYIDFIKEKIDAVCKRIIIKTIFIVGKNMYVSEISDGLNTQLPINEIDIWATKEEVEIINKVLQAENIKIVRVGEYTDEYNLSMLDFAKYYKLLSGEPGTSKNLNKYSIEDIVIGIKERLTCDDETVSKAEKEKLSQLKGLIEADKWWNENKRSKWSASDNDIENAVWRYGRNYYLAFLLLGEKVNPNNYSQYVEEIVRIIKTICPKIDAKEFKKNALFKKISEVYIESRDVKEINPVDYSKIETMLVGKHWKDITKLEIKSIYENELFLEDLRIIRVDLEKNLPFEHFSFNRLSFMELANHIDDEKYPIYEESQFYAEIHKKWNALILYINKDEKVESYTIIERFSFEEYDAAAKDVYDEVVAAFIQGDESLFTKISDKKGFHIRPKAKDGSDTFEFSNGKEITKRCFWANSDIVMSLIQNHNKE